MPKRVRQRTKIWAGERSPGNVCITTVPILEGAAETSATFRKGRKPEPTTATLALSSKDANHWTLTETGTDNNRPATIRLTTVRDGVKLVTLKEVDSPMTRP